MRPGLRAETALSTGALFLSLEMRLLPTLALYTHV